jgi:hypothetical protein
MTGAAGASNPQVRSQIRPSPQVARSAPRTLSRWKHGFEPRWDYPGQGACPGFARASGPALAPRRARGPHRGVYQSPPERAAPLHPVAAKATHDQPLSGISSDAGADVLVCVLWPRRRDPVR